MAAAAILNLDFGHISVTNKDSSVKFGVRTDNGHTTATIA